MAKGAKGYRTRTSAMINVELPCGMVKSLNYDIVTHMALRGRTSTVKTLMTTFRPSSYALSIAFTHENKLESVTKGRVASGLIDSLETHRGNAVQKQLKEVGDSVEVFTNLSQTIGMGTSCLGTSYGVPSSTHELPANLHGVVSCLTNAPIRCTQRTSLTNSELDKACFLVTLIGGQNIEQCAVGDREALLRFCENREITLYRQAPCGSYDPIDARESILSELRARRYKPKDTEVDAHQGSSDEPDPKRARHSDESESEREDDDAFDV
jgi:hypothetical protein